MEAEHDFAGFVGRNIGQDDLPAVGPFDGRGAAECEAVGPVEREKHDSVADPGDFAGRGVAAPPADGRGGPTDHPAHVVSLAEGGSFDLVPFRKRSTIQFARSHSAIDVIHVGVRVEPAEVGPLGENGQECRPVPAFSSRVIFDQDSRFWRRVLADLPDESIAFRIQPEGHGREVRFAGIQWSDPTHEQGDDGDGPHGQPADRRLLPPTGD